MAYQRDCSINKCETHRAEHEHKKKCCRCSVILPAAASSSHTTIPLTQYIHTYTQYVGNSPCLTEIEKKKKRKQLRMYASLKSWTEYGVREWKHQNTTVTPMCLHNAERNRLRRKKRKYKTEKAFIHRVCTFGALYSIADFHICVCICQ